MLQIITLLCCLLVLAVSQCCAFTNYQRIHHQPYTSSRRNVRGTPRRHQQQQLTMGMEVKLRMVGRKNNGEKWLEDAYSTYDTRLKPTNLNVQTFYHKNDNELTKNIEADESKNHKVILLDPLGKLVTSEVFSDNMYNWLEDGGSRLTFVIGGAEGLPEELKAGRSGKNDLLSLGKMTFTHQFARVLLMEQIYRASEIRKGSGYHK